MRPYEELTRIQDQASGEALGQLDRLWPALEDMAPGDARDTLLDVAPGLVDRWGSVTGAASADWYEDAREAALGQRGEAKLAELDLEAVEGSVRWAARDLFIPGRSGRARDRIGNVIDRHVRNMGRGTLAQSIDGDRANVRWARMMSGSETCPWCRMLASRGFVYKSKQSAGGDHAWGHDNCDCQIVPDFSLSDAEHDVYNDEVDALYNQYAWAGERIGVGRGQSPDDQSIAREWRRNIINYDRALTQLSITRSGSSSDGSIDIPAWDHSRQDLVTRLEESYPDGFAYGRRLMPRNPSQVPAGWGPASDMPEMDAETWNRVLYGFDGDGGYMAGHGWANSDEEPTELPEDWDSARIAAELQETITDGDLEESSGGDTYRRVTGGYSISVNLGTAESGARFVRSVLIS